MGLRTKKTRESAKRALPETAKKSKGNCIIRRRADTKKK